MDPREIARMITDHPDILSEDWEELGIADPGIEDLVEEETNAAIRRAEDACWAMLKDKSENFGLGKSDLELKRIYSPIMMELASLLKNGTIHYRSYEEIEKFIANAVEEAIWN